MCGSTNFPGNRFHVYEVLVKYYFRFLECEYAFERYAVERKQESYICIKYRTDRVYFFLYYATPGFELDCYFGRIGIDDLPGHLGFESCDLLHLDGCQAWSSYSGYSATSYENLRTCLPKLARFVRECGGACLRGDLMAYEKMRAARRTSAEHWHKNQEIARTKESAERAWRNRDHSRVVELFGAVEDELTTTEKKKLSYSRKRRIEPR